MSFSKSLGRAATTRDLKKQVASACASLVLGDLLKTAAAVGLQPGDPIPAELGSDAAWKLMHAYFKGVVPADLEYRLCKWLAENGIDPPDTPDEWDVLAIRTELPGEKDKRKIATYAIAMKRGPLGGGQGMSINEQLVRDCTFDPSLFRLTSTELGRRYGVTPAAIRQTEWWKNKREVARAAKMARPRA